MTGQSNAAQDRESREFFYVHKLFLMGAFPVDGASVEVGRV